MKLNKDEIFINAYEELCIAVENKIKVLKRKEKLIKINARKILL